MMLPCRVAMSRKSLLLLPQTLVCLPEVLVGDREGGKGSGQKTGER